jgi:outer membrane murein-binding lipoprotein Lpp
MRTIRWTTAAFVALATGCANPRTQANMAQALQDAASEMSTLRNDIAQLQTDMDSLRTVVAKQDSLLTRMAAVTGVPR